MAGHWVEKAFTCPPFSGSRRLVVRFGSYALHRPPPQEEGGKHQGPEARPKVKAHWGHPQSPPCSWNGQPAPAAFPEMVVGGRGGRLGPSALPSLAFGRPGSPKSVSPSVHPGCRGSSGFPCLPLGQARLAVQYATWCRKSPPRWPGCQKAEGVLPLKSPTSPGTGVGT